ncbi:MAG: M48 family metallopeptidase [Planctomycetes bacterium]|nr:M48 family metallopeptidase [Planctomycetota bacterium]
MSATCIDRDTLLGALDVEIERPRLSLLYRLGILSVAAILWILPLIYIALIALVGYGLYFHATESLAMFESRGGQRVKLFLYVAPLIAGGLLLIFMIKPLFAPRAHSDDRVELDPDREPFLFDFVDAVCRAVGAAPPRRILADCKVNASAGFHQGGTGLTGGGRELTIGLPLVAGLQLRNLVGVLAHEFGHFSQGTGMRLSGLVVRVQAWFARVVFERDAWDQRILDWSRSNAWPVTATGGVARALVWLTRRVLFALMWIARQVSSFTSRQMEFDADRYQIALAGWPVVGATLRELTRLSVAQQNAHELLGASWGERRLVDDLPALIVARRRAMSDELERRIDESLDRETVGRFDTHPRTVDREAAARAIGDDGVFAIDAPARILFDDFERLCRDATARHYRERLGRGLRDAELVPVAAYAAEQGAEDERRRSLRRYFFGTLSVMRAVALPAGLPGAPPDPRAVGARIRDLRGALRDGADRTRELTVALVACYDRRSVLGVAGAYVKAGRRIDPAGFGLPDAKASTIARAIADVDAAIPTARAELDAVAGRDEERLALALSMLQVEKVASRVDGAQALRAEVAGLLPAAVAIGRVLGDLADLRGELNVLGRLGAELRTEADHEAFRPTLVRRAGRLFELCGRLRATLGDARYPFPHPTAGLTVADHALPQVPPAGQLADLYNAAGAADGRLTELYVRLLASITHAAERVEAALGMPPMAPPEAVPSPAG